MEENKKLIFISYSHQNQSVCESIASMLSKFSSEVWYDKGLIPGEAYRKKIVQVIRKADYFVVLLSGESVCSEWVLDEVEYAKKQKKRILPIFIDAVELPDDLDMILQRYHCLFWYLRTSDEQFQENLELVFREKEDISHNDNKRAKFHWIEFSETENAQICRMLELESQGAYSECYSAEGACLLGKAYLYSPPCPENRKKADFYFSIAKYRGSLDGSTYLLLMRLDNQEEATWDEPDAKFCAPIIKDIRSLADQGSEAAMMLLAHYLWYGRYGCSRDLIQSAQLYEKCALNGNARAQYIMSSNYYMGEGVPKDYTLAIMFANLAMEQKYCKSWRRWGKFYRDGFAVPQNYGKARENYEKGAQAGDYNCYNKIGDMLFYGWGYEVDYHAAFEYYLKGEQAPEQGQSYGLWKAKQALGRCYELGLGTEANLEIATEKYLEGYRLGSEECKRDYLRCANTLMKQRNGSTGNQ